MSSVVCVEQRPLLCGDIDVLGKVVSLVAYRLGLGQGCVLRPQRSYLMMRAVRGCRRCRH